DSRIAKAGSPYARRNLAAYGQETPPSPLHQLVGLWWLVNQERGRISAMAEKPAGPTKAPCDGGVARYDDHCVLWERHGQEQGRMLAHTRRTELAMKLAAEFIRDAMLAWDADALIALGKEMRAAASANYDLDRHRRVLLASMAVSNTTVGDCAEAILEHTGR